MIILRTGYSGDKYTHPLSKIQGLKAVAEHLNAHVVDIRFSPNSRAPMWRREQMAAALGARYVHIQELGNRNYNKCEEIEIADMQAGIQKLLALSEIPSTPNAILLCACEFPNSCHRSVVMNALWEHPRVLATAELVEWRITRGCVPVNGWIAKAPESEVGYYAEPLSNAPLQPGLPLTVVQSVEANTRL